MENPKRVRTRSEERVRTAECHLQGSKLDQPAVTEWLDRTECGGRELMGDCGTYYLLLRPLPADQNAIRFHGSLPGFTLDVTYNLRVLK